MIASAAARPLVASGERPDATSLQVVMAEYAMLQASLKLSWDLTQQRTATYFTVLSAAAVAIGLVAQASGGTALAPFAVAALGIAMFVGLSTFLRVVQALQEVTIIVLGMNGIRGFLKAAAAPEYAGLFTLPARGDEASLHIGIGGMHGHGAEGMRGGYGVLQIPGVIAAINAGLAAAAITIATAEVTTETAAISLGVLVFSAVLAGSLRHWRKAADEIRHVLVRTTAPAIGR